jgi:imidazoleglycerol-phosphate dehydratase
MSERAADIRRETGETAIRARIDLDGTGRTELDTGIGFFDHMLAQVARHGLVDLAVSAAGDLGVDGHHTVEDIGITLGQAVAQALGEPRGIARYGHAYVPLDEALSRVVIDFSGRPGLVFGARFTREWVGALDTELVAEFFRGFVNHGRCTLHVDTLRGDNDHHVIETQFKAFGRALRAAVAGDERLGDVAPSTKGSL